MGYIAATILSISCLITAVVSADTYNFDNDKVDMPPEGWSCGIEGGGDAKWLVKNDASAPSKENVLTQDGEGKYSWCKKNDASLKDGYVEVKIKPSSEKEDQALGILWRYTDDENYYVASLNPTSKVVSVSCATGGVRRGLKLVPEIEFLPNQWNTLKALFKGKEIQLFLNGKKYIELKDDLLEKPGTVGLWTKAFGISSFDDFSFGPEEKK